MFCLEFSTKPDRIESLIVYLVAQVSQVQLGSAPVRICMALQGDARLAGAVVEQQLTIWASDDCEAGIGSAVIRAVAMQSEGSAGSERAHRTCCYMHFPARL